jgi:beta-RFAP synthase
LFEAGKRPGETISPLEHRVAFPAEWRFILVCPRQKRGLHGDSERHAFSELPPVSPEVSDRLAQHVREQMLPAAESRDFDRFSKSLYEYGYQAGLCFSSIQGGAFNGPEAEQIVAGLRRHGIVGAGQSSWGPTIFGLCPSQRDAERVASKLRDEMQLAAAEIWVSGPCNSGADIHVQPGVV